MADDRVLIDATNKTFWRITQYKPGQKLDMSIAEDRRQAKRWLEIYAQIKGHRDRATQLAQQAFNEVTTPYILVVEQRDGSLSHREFVNRGGLDVQYSWLVDQPEQYTYLAAFDFTKSRDVPVFDQFALSTRQQMTTSGWYGYGW